MWRYFLIFVIKEIFRGRFPFKINKEEILGRALFSGHYKKGKILAGAFKLKDPSKGISVNRITYAPRNQIDLLSKADAQRRKFNFYGYALIKGEDVGCIRLDRGKSLGVKVTPKYKNPFHADITLPVDEGKDFYLLIADELLQKATFCGLSEQ